MQQPVSVISAGIVVVDHVAAPIPHLPKPGELVLTDDCQLHIGGCASNVAIDLARLGVSSRVVGCIGDDPLGGFVRDQLTAEGVDVGGLLPTNGAPTSQTLVVNVQGEDRRFIHLIGANSRLNADMLPLDVIYCAKSLYVGGLFLMDAMDAGELAEVFRAARQAGVVTFLDVVVPGERMFKADLCKILPHTDFFLPNSDEATAMTNLREPPDQARRFREWGARNVIVTCGRRGCVFSSPDAEFYAGAFEVPFVDGTGGGDAFAAGFIAALLQGLEPIECVRWGAAMGASCVQSSGATHGVFRRDQLDAFLASRTLEIRPIHSSAAPSH
jgi:sugar/nucleoside kinase (ribokinase family)